MKYALLSSTILLSTVAFAQCPLADQDTCIATVDQFYTTISGTQTLFGSSQCFYIPDGATLNYEGTNGIFLVESGGTVNVVGLSHLVLAKSAANVGFCGSTSGNKVNHEGAMLNCLGGNVEQVCGQVIFHTSTGIPTLGPTSTLRYDATQRRLVLHNGTGTVEILDAIGRTVRLSPGGSSVVDVSDLTSGAYLARLQGVDHKTQVRFVIR